MSESGRGLISWLNGACERRAGVGNLTSRRHRRRCGHSSVSANFCDNEKPQERVDDRGRPETASSALSWAMGRGAAPVRASHNLAMRRRGPPKWAPRRRSHAWDGRAAHRGRRRRRQARRPARAPWHLPTPGRVRPLGAENGGQRRWRWRRAHRLFGGAFAKTSRLPPASRRAGREKKRTKRERLDCGSCTFSTPHEHGNGHVRGGGERQAGPLLARPCPWPLAASILRHRGPPRG